MIIEQTLEAQIIEAFRAALSDGVFYSGAWQTAAVGEVKGDEPADADTVCAVTVSPRSMPDYGGGQGFVEADFPVSVYVNVRGELDATGIRALEVWNCVAPIVWRWVTDADAQTVTALTVTREGEAVFQPGGVQQTGGTPPTWNAQTRAWSFGIDFTVKGIITE